jgi:hypothetical protein
MSDSLPTFEEALAAAVEEGGTTEPPAAATDPVSAATDSDDAGEQAPTTEGGSEQPPATNEIDDLLVLAAKEAPPALTPQDDAFWDQKVEVVIDGVTTEMSLGDMRGGAMMQADYTRKTQELARERRLLEEASEFYSEFRKDPTGMAAYLAAKAGLIEEGKAPSKEISILSGGDVEAQVEERLDAALAEHPDVKKAKEALALGAVNDVFAQLEKEYETTISSENRTAVLTEAKRAGTTDIRLVFEAMLLRGAQQRQALAEVKKTGTARSGGTPAPEGDEGVPPVGSSIEDFFDYAIRQQGEPVTA